MGNVLTFASPLAVGPNDDVYVGGIYSDNVFEIAAPVPEPGVVASFACCALALAGLARRRSGRE